MTGHAAGHTGDPDAAGDELELLLNRCGAAGRQHDDAGLAADRDGANRLRYHPGCVENGSGNSTPRYFVQGAWMNGRFTCLPSSL